MTRQRMKNCCLMKFLISSLFLVQNNRENSFRRFALKWESENISDDAISSRDAPVGTGLSLFPQLNNVPCSPNCPIFQNTLCNCFINSSLCWFKFNGALINYDKSSFKSSTFVFPALFSLINITLFVLIGAKNRSQKWVFQCQSSGSSAKISQSLHYVPQHAQSISSPRILFPAFFFLTQA